MGARNTKVTASEFGVIGVGFDFFDLFGVAFGVSPDKKDEFVGVPLGSVRSAWAVNSVVTKARSRLKKLFGLGAAFNEVIN